MTITGCVLSLIVMAGAAQAQNAPPIAKDAPLIRVDVSLVNVVAIAEDNRGHFVTGLLKDDFEILDNGHRQPITHFDEEGSSPLTVALLIDTSESALNLIEQEKEAAKRFLAEVMRPGDKALLVGFGARVFVWQHLTSSTAELNSALDRIHPLESSDPNAGTLLYQAAYTVASSDEFRAQRGRKAIVILSDGLDNGGVIKERDSVKAVQEAEAVVFGIHSLDLRQIKRSMGIWNYINAPSTAIATTSDATLAGWAKAVGMSTLRKLASPTGGRTVDVDEKMPLEAVFSTIRDETRHEYEIGFTPPAPQSSGEFHRLEVRCKKHGVKIRARSGYYSKH
jgi:Ca-activated chloride channel family protein